MRFPHCTPVLLAVLVAAPSAAQQPARTSAPAPRVPAAMSRIREADLRRDMELLGGVAMRGREAGTVDEMRASMWLAEEMRRIGVRPMGEDGGWFQWWMMRRTRVSTPNSAVRLGDRALALWQEIEPVSNAAAELQGPALMVRDPRDTTVDVRGRIVVVDVVAPPPASIRSTTNTWEHNYTRSAITALATPLVRRGAAAVILVADSVAERAFTQVGTVQARGTYDVVGGVPRFSRNPSPPAPPAGRPRRPRWPRYRCSSPAAPWGMRSATASRCRCASRRRPSRRRL